MKWKEGDYDEKDVARFRWITILACDPAYADHVGGEKTIVMVSAHGSMVEQAMFSMRDARLLLKRLVFSMHVNGDDIATKVFEQFFEDQPGGEGGSEQPQ